MLKFAIYCNVFILYVLSSITKKRISKNNSELKNLKQMEIIFLIFNIINYYLCVIEIVDLGWNIIFIFFISLMTFLIHIVSIYSINKKLKKLNDVHYNEFTLKNIIVCLIPVFIFLIPYTYELYVINNCNYLLQYNYQEGFIQSDDTYIAIINNKPVPITLQINIFDRRGFSIDEMNYDIIYENNNEILIKDVINSKIIVNNEDLKKISLDAKERCPSAKSADIDYFPEGNYAIVTLLSGETSGTLLGEYFYHNNEYIKSIKTHGSLSSVTYYQ